ncbi:RNA polymerase sigma factor [Pedobacter helvus]|uniref:RNA polymerase sigma factor n=1 Tax=Pedobacter helvus TaxID=2563444 RepID=A0ABW9JL27_9SPHI|nr:sigma-70 family RNA polymerase sigma factor [Pedobacter ureilyticus]
MKNLSDLELIELVRSASYGAFEELHRRYWSDLQKLAYSKIGDREDTYDLLQEMFIELWEKRTELKFGNELNGWLRKRLWFKLYGYFRTKGFNQKHQDNFKIFADAENTTTAFDLSELKQANVYYEELLAVIEGAIEEMPDRMREVFVLYRHKNYSVSQIADKLGIAPKTVRNQLDRAIAKLRKSTKQYDPRALELVFVLWLIS